MPAAKIIAPCLWLDGNAEEVVNFYLSIFKDSKIVSVRRYGKAGNDIHHRPAGSVMTINFELNSQGFTALNGGPEFKFNEAISFQVFCDTQQEIDHYWEKLGQGGDPKAQQCGWLKDKFGVSWQVVPTVMDDLINEPDHPGSERAMNAMLKMKKIDIAALKRAREGA